MNTPLPNKYFWSLDNELPQDVIKGYREALGPNHGSTLSNIVSLLEAKIPITPKAYLTSSIGALKGKPSGELIKDLELAMGRIEGSLHHRFGNRERPLLLNIHGDLCGSVRNLGMGPNTLLARIHDLDAESAYALYIDFLESFSTLVLRCPHIDFKKTFSIQSTREGNAQGLGQITEQDFLRKVKEYQNLVSQNVKLAFPESLEQQLIMTLAYFSKSLSSGQPDEVFIDAQLPRSQAEQSINGVVYSRNPFTGKKDLYGVYQCGPSGGPKHPLEPVDETETRDPANPTLRDRFPAVYGLLKRHLPQIEGAFQQIIEATFVTDADGHLFFTQFDRAQSTPKATIVCAMELNREGKIPDLEAASRIRPKDVEVLLHPTLDDRSRVKLKSLNSAGVTAAPGTSVGHVFFKMADAIDFYRNAVKNKTDKRVILIADELLISDTPGLGIISGLVTRASGIASHAAVMARANGIPCIVGYRGLEIHPERNCISVNGAEVPAGTLMTLEAGAEGQLYLGEGTLQNVSFQEGVVRDVAQLLSRVIREENIPFEVRVNINNAKDAETGLCFGADGVGLCRTENMFMEPAALREIRNIVFTQNADACADSFKQLESMQFEDFRKIFQVMKGRTVNIRLMDLPLHDLAPQREEDFEELCKMLNHLGRDHLRGVAESLKEHNPMLGLRACRFGLITPPVYNMQIRAIIRAAYTVSQEGLEVKPGIMFPLVFSEEELSRLKARVVEIEKSVREELKVPFNTKIHVKVGTMIELPAAALSTDHLAKIGEFFAFGTNDLTQTTLGMSRDDSAHYLPAYIEKGIMHSDPFKVLADPVRQLIEIAVSRGRRVRKDSSFGICGEQGGDPATLSFGLLRGLNYVSCSPFRVLTTKVALLHAALLNRSNGQDHHAAGEHEHKPQQQAARVA